MSTGAYPFLAESGWEGAPKHERAPKGASRSSSSRGGGRLLDHLLSLGVEEMDAIRNEGEPDLLVRLRLHGGLDARHDLLGGRLGVEEDLRPQRLHDLDYRLERQVGRVRAGSDAEVFRPNAQRHHLALVGHEALRLLGGNLDLDPAGLGEEGA